MNLLSTKGRKAKSPDSAKVTVELARPMIERIERFAIAEFHVRRADAIVDLLERGLAANESVAS